MLAFIAIFVVVGVQLIFAFLIKRAQKPLIPYSEGMALYQQIKQRHDDLLRELADL